MKIVQRSTSHDRTLPPILVNGSEGAVWETDAGAETDHLVLAGLVREAFRKDPGLQGRYIEIEAFADVVQLSGFVRSLSDMKRALEVASAVSGVTAVRNCMQLAWR